MSYHVTQPAERARLLKVLDRYSLNRSPEWLMQTAARRYDLNDAKQRRAARIEARHKARAEDLRAQAEALLAQAEREDERAYRAFCWRMKAADLCFEAEEQINEAKKRHENPINTGANLDVVGRSNQRDATGDTGE